MAGRISKRGELKGVGFGEGLHHPKMMEIAYFLTPLKQNIGELFSGETYKP